MTDTTRKAWEIDTDAYALRALAGLSTRDEFIRDREDRARELIDTCAIKPDGTGFEIGSGNGLVARLLSPNCARLDCSDVSTSFLRAAAESCLGCRNVFFHQITDTYLAHLPADTYDFGFALNVFIHLNTYDIYHYLQDVKRLLKPSGLFYFDACMLGEQTLDIFRRHAVIYRREPPENRGVLYFNTPEDIALLVKEVGLELCVDRASLGQSGWLKVLVKKEA
jgi:SAM-dependent methyltransferase